MHGRTVFAVLLIGMSLLFLTPQNAARTAKSTKAQSGSFLSMYENVTTHDGDLIIDGTQTFVIENCTYVQTGNIHVRDYGKLIIRNATFVVNQTYGEQYRAMIEGYGGLEIENSEITTLCSMDVNTGGIPKITINHAKVSWNFFFSPQTSVTIINSTLESVSWRNSYISVVNSTINLIGIDFDAVRVVTIDGLKPNLYQSWEFREDDSYLILEHTRVKQWRFWFYSNSIVTATNSELCNIALTFSADSMVEIHNLKPGRYGFWNLQTNESVRNVSFDLTLKNTSVESWTIVASGSSQMNISNTTAHIGAFELGEVRIENSIVDFLHFGDGAAEVTVMNSRMNGLWFTYFHGNAFLNKTEVEIGQCVVHHSDLYLSGDFAFSVRADNFGVLYSSSSITRNFNIIAEDSGHNPLEDAKLSLLDEGSESIWNGTTDSLGKADFNVTFSDGNYTDALRLEAVKGNLSGVQNVAFLSDTPVIVELGLHDDAIANAVPLKTVVGQGFPVHMNVTPYNRGNFAETFNVTVYANGTQIETQPVTLKNGTSTSMTFTLNTTGFAYGNYSVSAVADTVPNEADTTNNNFTCGTPVHVGVPGDISGPTLGVYDGKCDMRDISYLIIRFNSKPSSANWNPNADINDDGTVNMRDISVAIINFNKHE